MSNKHEREEKDSITAIKRRGGFFSRKPVIGVVNLDEIPQTQVNVDELLNAIRGTNKDSIAEVLRTGRKWQRISKA